MNELIISLILALIGALGAWVSKNLIPYIKARTTLSQQEDINYWVGVAVSAAEQLEKQIGNGESKYKYVADFLQSKGFNFTEDEIRVLIESAVLRLKAGVL